MEQGKRGTQNSSIKSVLVTHNSKI